MTQEEANEVFKVAVAQLVAAGYTIQVREIRINGISSEVEVRVVPQAVPQATPPAPAADGASAPSEV